MCYARYILFSRLRFLLMNIPFYLISLFQDSVLLVHTEACFHSLIPRRLSTFTKRFLELGTSTFVALKVAWLFQTSIALLNLSHRT